MFTGEMNLCSWADEHRFVFQRYQIPWLVLLPKLLPAAWFQVPSERTITITVLGRLTVVEFQVNLKESAVGQVLLLLIHACIFLR